jgi:tRNA-dihydrouridine synthase B
MNEAASRAPLPSYSVGPVRVSPGLVLAPMSGVTDSPFRRLVKACSGDALGLVVSEFINVDMLTRGQLRAAVRMAFDESERPVSIQLYGSDPATMVEAARMVEGHGADLVDINAGCPEPKICRRGGGAGLLRDLPRLSAIVEGVARAVSIPTTLKCRNGWDADSLNAHETLRRAEEAGAAALAIHGRTRVQLYTGRADWDVVRLLKQVARIPILGSGDVSTAEEARTRFTQTTCDGLLIGRAAVRNPWIFRQIRDAWEGRPVFRPTWGETHDALAGYLGLLSEAYPPNVAPGRMKMMLSRLLRGFPGRSSLRLEVLREAEPPRMLGLFSDAIAAHGLRDVMRDMDAETAEPAQAAEPSAVA